MKVDEYEGGGIKVSEDCGCYATSEGFVPCESHELQWGEHVKYEERKKRFLDAVAAATDKQQREWLMRAILEKHRKANEPRG